MRDRDLGPVIGSIEALFEKARAWLVSHYEVALPTIENYQSSSSHWEGWFSKGTGIHVRKFSGHEVVTLFHEFSHYLHCIQNPSRWEEYDKENEWKDEPEEWDAEKAAAVDWFRFASTSRKPRAGS
jgi:hypothetical protein